MMTKDPISPSNDLLATSEDANQTIELVCRKTLLSNGTNLWDFGLRRRLLLVFVRHAGCTFCRETLVELKGKLPSLQKQEIIPVVIHLGTPDDGERMLARAGLQGTLHVSNPNAELYRAYQLKRGRLSQLLSPRVWWRGFQSAILKGFGFGSFVGDGFQLGGAFLVESGRIVKSFPAKDAADKVPFECILE
jgi:peroxiredoxin